MIPAHATTMVSEFKAAYKEAKAGVKEFMTQTSAPAEFEITIKGSVGVDNLFHPGDVVYCGSKLNMKAVVYTLPKIGDVIPATDLIGEYDAHVKVREILDDYPPRPAHLQAACDTHHDELFLVSLMTVLYLPKRVNTSWKL